MVFRAIFKLSLISRFKNSWSLAAIVSFLKVIHSAIIIDVLSICYLATIFIILLELLITHLEALYFFIHGLSKFHLNLSSIDGKKVEMDPPKHYRFLEQLFFVK